MKCQYRAVRRAFPMRVTILFFGMLKDIVGRAEDRLTVEEGSSVGRLYELYAARFPKLAEHSSSLLFSRNREFASRSESLKDGDEVAFLPPVSGGSSTPTGSGWPSPRRPGGPGCTAGESTRRSPPR